MEEHAGGPVSGSRAERGAGERTLVGREAELARLFRVVDAPSEAGPVMVIAGDVGTGKTVLLDSAVRRAAARGTRVLRAEGSESESGLAFSALHQLLRPVRGELEELPERQRAALRDAFGMGEGVVAPDLMLIGVAVLSLLSGLGERGPVLVALDDAQWCDSASLDALSFAARRLADEPVTVLAGVRDGGDPDQSGRFERFGRFGRRVPTLVLGPLDHSAAHRLLDLQPMSPTGRARIRVLDEADGNPLALTELTRAAGTASRTTAPPAAPHSGPARDAAAHPFPAQHPAPGSPAAHVSGTHGSGTHGSGTHGSGTPEVTAGPLPLSRNLERIFAARLRGLPAPAARALLLLAAMDSTDAALVARIGLPDAEDAAWLPAQEAGLVRLTGRELRFRHPLARSAVYHAASSAARREAHRALAALLRDEPDRRAWHLAAAASHPDAAVSAELERTAGRARRRGGNAAAATALQRAAELAPGRQDSARLLVEAAGAAMLTGDLAWVEELTGAASARTGDAKLLASAAVHAGRLATLTTGHTAVFSRLADAVERLAPTQPGATLDLLSGAAVVRYYSGNETQHGRIQSILGRLPEHGADDWQRTWVRAVSNPSGHRAEAVAHLPQLAARADGRPERLTALGVMAWLLDEPRTAVRAFDEAFGHRQPRGPLPEGLGGAAAWAYVERGRWGQARELCARTTAVGASAGLDHAVSCAAAVDAMVLALQGDTAAARARAEEALALVDPLESRSVAVFARRALAAAAASDGAYESAYGQLRPVFTAEGAPVHYHASYPALAELAAAAVRGGGPEAVRETAALVERSARTLGDSASPRLRALIERARGLLAEPADAEAHFRAALADPALEHWPFERAQTLLDLAEWLRRRRRIAEARAPLAEALEVFRRLGARPWAERARAEARAAGLDVTGARAPDALAGLSPQQRQIIELAARGLTNREIGEKLFLSPRTVGSHLYRSFPKLGITARSQLRDLMTGPLPVAR